MATFFQGPRLSKKGNTLRYATFVFSVGGARVGGILITSLTFPYIVRQLGVKEYGIWSYVVAICAFLDILSNPGLTTYAGREVAAHREGAFSLVADILTLRLFAALLACGLLLVIVLLEPEHQIRNLFLLYGLGFLISGVIAVDYLFNSLELFHAASGLRIGQQFIYAVAVFCLVRGPQDILWVPGSILLSTFLSNVVGWIWLANRGLRLSLRFQPEHWREILVPSFHYAASSFLSSTCHRAGHIVVRWFLGEYALGIYSAAVRLVDLLRSLVVMLLSVLVPRMAQLTSSKEEFRRWAQIAFVAVAATSIPMALGLMLTSRWAVLLAMGRQYLSAVPLIKWMSFYIIVASSASLFAGTILYSMGRHRAYLASTASGAIAGLVLYLALVPLLGLQGGAIAFVAAELCVAIAAYSLLPQDLRGLWKSQGVGFAAGAGLVMFGVVWVVGMYDPTPLILILSGVMVYVSLCGWFFKRWLTSQTQGAA